MTIDKEMNATKTENGEIDTSSRQRPYWGDGRHELLGWLNKLIYSQLGLANIYTLITTTFEYGNMLQLSRWYPFL